MHDSIVYSSTIPFANFDIIEEVQITNKHNPLTIDKLGNCKVYVYTGEGQIPHFHINSDDDKFKSCVCIYSNHYFAHGGKYTNQFNNKQRKQFNSWMEDNWDIIKNAWEKGNPDCKFPEKDKVSTKPHYENMSQIKSE